MYVQFKSVAGNPIEVPGYAGAAWRATGRVVLALLGLNADSIVGNVRNARLSFKYDTDDCNLNMSEADPVAN